MGTFYSNNDYRNYLMHYGVKGMKWGVRRYMNADGTLTAAGKARAKKDGRGALTRAKIYAQHLTVGQARERIGQFKHTKGLRKISAIPYFGSGAMAATERNTAYMHKRLALASEPGSRRHKLYSQFSKNAASNARYFERQANAKSWQEYKDREAREFARLQRITEKKRAQRAARR